MELARDCEEGFEKGSFTSDGVYNIHPLNSELPFPVMCKDKPNNRRTYIMERKEGTEDFHRNFHSYRDGFGSVSGDHWLGLEKIHLLATSKPYELRVSIQTKDGTNRFQQYEHFVVSNATSGYKLFFNYTVPDTLLGDCLTPLLGASFSTYDHDQDESVSINCAAKHQGGFWFRGDTCSTCNPTGPLTLPADGLRYGVDNEAFWTVNLGDLAPFRVTMFLVAL
nr:hypothetical protein BaRGS_027748 [Batillaria attramentaria]